MRKTFWAIAAILLAALHGPAAAEEAYRYADLHPAGWRWSEAVTVNAAGDVAGFGLSAEGVRGFLWSGGRLTVVMPPGATEARVVGMNGNGVVVGTACIDGNPRAFAYHDGHYGFPAQDWVRSEAGSVGEDGTVYGTGALGAFAERDGEIEVFPFFSAIAGSNSSGILVGDGDNTARILKPGQGYVSINPPGAISSETHGINESGFVALTSIQASGPRGYVYREGFFVLMTPPGWRSSSVMSINNGGEAVGFGESPTGRKGFRRSGATYTDIQFPGWTSTQAVSINDRSQVAGTGVAPDGESHAFLASPAGGGSASDEAPGQAASGGGCAVARGMRCGNGPDLAILVAFLSFAVRRTRNRRR
jgi:hypothetical protein